MSRTKKTYRCVCVQSFEHVIPASVLEIRDPVSGALQATIDTPEKRIPYTTGEVVDMWSARSLKDFMKFHAGKFEVVS